MSALEQEITIIMVEDDEGHARLIEKNLRRAGINNPLCHFNTGKKAVDFLFSDNANHAPEHYLILLDLNLPEMDGFEVLTRIKENPHTRLIPVIILTTTDNPIEIDRCYALGCSVYVTKPIEYDKFSEAIKRLGLVLSIVKLPSSV